MKLYLCLVGFLYMCYIFYNKNFYFFKKRELMRKQHNLGDVCACATSLAGRMRCGRRIGTYSSKEESKEEKYIFVYRNMLAYWVSRLGIGPMENHLKPADISFF